MQEIKPFPFDPPDKCIAGMSRRRLGEHARLARLVPPRLTLPAVVGFCLSWLDCYRLVKNLGNPTGDQIWRGLEAYLKPARQPGQTWTLLLASLYPQREHSNQPALPLPYMISHSPRAPKKIGPMTVKNVTSAITQLASPRPCNAQPPPAKLVFLTTVDQAAPQCGQGESVEISLRHWWQSVRPIGEFSKRGGVDLLVQLRRSLRI